MTNENTMSVGVRFCSNCEYNLRCAECAYKGKYETLAEKHDFVLDEAKRMKSELDDLKRDTIPKLENSLKRANEYSFETDKHNQQLIVEIREYEQAVKRAKADGFNYALEWLQSNSYVNFSPERRKQIVKEMVGE